MKMKAIRMLGTLAMTAAVAMVVGACSSDDNLVDNGAADGATASARANDPAARNVRRVISSSLPSCR